MKTALHSSAAVSFDISSGDDVDTTVRPISSLVNQLFRSRSLSLPPLPLNPSLTHGKARRRTCTSISFELLQYENICQGIPRSPSTEGSRPSTAPITSTRGECRNACATTSKGTCDHLSTFRFWSFLHRQQNRSLFMGIESTSFQGEHNRLLCPVQVKCTATEYAARRVLYHVTRGEYMPVLLGKISPSAPPSPSSLLILSRDSMDHEQSR